jgi:large subunit ribosomal protein L25
MVKVVAERRRELGSPAARRLRRAGGVPGVLYGAGIGEPVPVSVDRHAFLTALGQHVVVGQLLDLELDGEVRTVKLQAVARHPVRRDLAHLDFLAVASSESIEAQVPLEAAEGVMLQVGVVRLGGLPGAIPASLRIERDHVAEGPCTAGSLRLPAGVELLDPADLVVAVLEEG